jgi:hypothetical protein
VRKVREAEALEGISTSRTEEQLWALLQYLLSGDGTKSVTRPTEASASPHFHFGCSGCTTRIFERATKSCRVRTSVSEIQADAHTEGENGSSFVLAG